MVGFKKPKLSNQDLIHYQPKDDSKDLTELNEDAARFYKCVIVDEEPLYPGCTMFTTYHSF